MGLWITRPTRLLNAAGLMFVLGTSLPLTAAAQSWTPVTGVQTLNDLLGKLVPLFEGPGSVDNE